MPKDDANLNGNLDERVEVDTTTLDWSPSPSGSVWRKRMHRVGPAESGQVTSIVRYEPNSRFPPHEHPEGEEILVLEGVFSDEAGDWEAGSYLLNPEGFRHAPFSEEGCIIFVKLRQAPGTDRRHVQLQTADLAWEEGDNPGRASKFLYRQDGHADTMRLEQWTPDTEGIELEWPLGAELYVIEGEFSDGEGRYSAGHWLRLPAGSRQRARTGSGCELYIKEGGFAYLQRG